GGEGREECLVSRGRPLLHGWSAPRLRARRGEGRLDPDAGLAGGEARATAAGETRARHPSRSGAVPPAHGPLTDARGALEASRDLSAPTHRHRFRSPLP